MVEESSTVPNKSRFIQNRKFKHGDEMMPQYGKLGHVSGSLSKGQRALLGNLDASGKAVLVIYDELNDEENPYAILEPFQKVSLHDNVHSYGINTDTSRISMLHALKNKF